MAHVDSLEIFTTKISIMNEKGVPLFFEWIPEIPDKSLQPMHAKYITKIRDDGKEKHYRVSKIFELNVTNLSTYIRECFGQPEEILILEGEDENGKVIIDFGLTTSRYSIDLMRRLLNPSFDPSQVIRITPYRIENKNGILKIGISAMQPPNNKLLYSQSSDFLSGCPKAEKLTIGFKTFWDFTNVSKWLMEEVNKKLGNHHIKEVDQSVNKKLENHNKRVYQDDPWFPNDIDY